MDWLKSIPTEVAASLVGAGVLGLVVLLVAPVRNRIASWWLGKTRDHGVKIKVYTRPDQMTDLSPEDLPGGDPGYYTSMNSYVRAESPPSGPETGEEWWEWAMRHNAEDAFGSHVLLLIQATLDRTIVIRPPVVTDSHTSVTSGIICGPEGQGGNGLLVRRFYIDLDESRPRARYVDRVSGEKASATFRMSKGETMAILAIATARSGRHEWYMDLPILVDGHEVILRADNGRKPFVTVGPAGIQAHLWASDSRSWHIRNDDPSDGDAAN